MKYDNFIKADTSPNGTQYFSVRTPKQTFGSIYPIDGGFLSGQCRKPVATLDEAVEKLLHRKLRTLREEMIVIEGLLAK